MSHKFKVGDTVRHVDGAVGTISGIDPDELLDLPYFVGNFQPARDAYWYGESVLCLVAPASQPTKQLSGNFSLHGFGLQELFLFIDAFQAVGEDKFKIEWTLSGTAGESGSL